MIAEAVLPWLARNRIHLFTEIAMARIAMA
jgi:hypothetical protein